MSIVLIAIALWIVVPPPTPLLLNLAVGAPELSPWLLLLSLLLAGIAALDIRTNQSARLALALAASAALLSSVPLIQVAAAARQADDAMTTGLGEAYWSQVPHSAQVGTRPRALIASELFFGLRPAPVRITRGVSLSAEGGEPLALELYRPERSGTYPIVVQIYGGAWQWGAVGDNALFARELAGSGLLVFAIDYRHAPRWRWPAQLADIRVALRWIRRHAAEYGGDATRLALLGRSSGAQLAMMAAYEPDAPAVRAVVNYYGPVDLVEGYRHPPDPDPLNVRAIQEAFLGGSPEQVPEAYRTASPISYINRALPPTLSIYGMRDCVVEPRFGALLHARLRATGTTSVFMRIPWAGHAFDAVPQGPSGQLALYHTERFLAWALASR